MIRTPSQATVIDLEHEMAVLEQRLRDGERRIEEAQTVGTETGAWEEFWIELLHTYESICDRHRELVASGVQIAA